MSLDIDVIKKLIDVFATKEDLKRVEENMATKQDINNVKTGLDKVLKEVVTSRQEQAALTQHQEEIFDRLDTIKATPTVAHELRLKK